MDDVSFTFVKTLIEFQKFGFPNNNFQIAHIENVQEEDVAKAICNDNA